MTRTLRFYAYSVIFLAIWYLRPEPVFAQCSIVGLNPTYCSDDAAVTLTGSDSFWGGTGISGGNTFTPSAAPVGSNTIAGVTYTESTGTFNPIPGSGTAVTLGDETATGAITLPFSFRFFNLSTSNIRIGSNGIVGFVATGLGSGVNQTLPSATAPNAIIAAAWDDLNPAAGGTIEYFTSGTSPNRVFVVNYTNVPQKATGIPVTVQIQLYEGSFRIEIHTTSADFSSSTATQGIESPLQGALTFAYPATGRNNTNWTATNECKVFTLCRTTQTITVNAVPSLASAVTPASTTICAGGTVGVTIAGTNAAVLYQLRNAATSAPLSGYFYGNGGNLTITSNAISANTTIRVYAKNGTTGCDSDLTNTVNVTVAAQPVSNAGSDMSVCGTSTVLAGSAPPPGGSGMWTIVTAPGSVSFGDATLRNTTVTAGASGVYVLRWTVSNAPCTSSADDVQITFQPNTSITTSPAAAVICEGGTTSFSVVANGVGLGYQWQVNTGSGFANIPSATASMLMLSGVTSTMNGYLYRVVVSGSCGAAVTSGAASLTVEEQPEITLQPVNAVTCEGSNASFTVNAGGTTGATYQWQISTNGGSTYTNVSNGGIYSGATNPTLNLTGTALTNNGYLYRVIVSGTCGPAVTSDAGVLTVQQTPVITGPPSGQIVCEGSTVAFTVNAVGAGLTYQWKKGGVEIGSATSASLVLTSVNAANAGSYTVLVKGTCNTTGVLSSAATLTVNEQPEITAQPGNAIICEGANTSFTVNAGVTTGATYQWQVSTNGGTSYANVSNGGIYAGATSATLSLTGAPLGNNGYLYRVIVGGTCTPNITSDGALLTVQQAPVITGQPSSQIVCEGSTVTFVVGAVGTGLTYQWKKGGVDIGGATSASLVLTSVNAANAGSYTVLVKGTCNTTGVLSSAATLTVNEQPEITAQPGNAIICEGGNTSFTVNAGVTTGATYQWQVSTNGGTSYSNVSNGGIYAGATSATLSLTGAPLGNNGYLYRVIVGGTCTPNVTSDGALLTVQQVPVITGQPSSQIVCEGSTVTFVVGAVGTGLTYQWKKGGVDIGGATSASLVLTSVNAANAGSYTVLVKGTCNTTGVLSSAATLTVNEQPEITAQPGNAIICEGANTSFTVNAGVTTGATYQWQVSTNGGTSYSNVSNGGIYAGATSATLSLTGAPLGNNGYLYRVIVGGTCTPNITSDGALLTVQQVLVITGQPSSQIVCEGSTVTFAVNATGAGLTYQWKKGGVDIGSATSASLVLTSVNAANAGSYTVLVKGTCNTTGVLSSAATLTVNEQPEITAQPGNAIICEGGNTSFTVNAGVTTGATYQWQVSTNGGTSYSNVSNGGIYAGATSATLSLTGAPLGNNGYLYRVIVGGTCSPGVTSDGALLTVQQAPVITGQPSTQVVCEGSAVTFSVSATGTGLTYQWKKGGVDIGGATGSSLVLSSVSAADAASYTVLVKGTCNTTGVLSSAGTLTVNEQPEVTAQPVSSVICEGGNTSFTVSAGVTTGATYQWQVSTNGGTSYANVSNGGIYAGATSATLSLTGATLGNNSYLYRVVVGGTCSPGVMSNGALLTVQQAPVITGQPSTQVVCEGSTVTFTVSAVGTGLTYQWKKAGVDIGSATGASLVLSSVSAADAASYTVLVKGTCNTTGVLSSVANLTINEQPEITAQPVNSVICEGGNTNFTISAGVTTAATYQWQVSTNSGTSYANVSNGGIYTGATGATLSLTGAPLGNNGYLYRVIVGGTCSPGVTSDGALLTVQQAPVITGQPSAQIVCEGSTVTFTVNATGTGLTYQWKKGGVDIGSATGSSLVLSSVSAADAASYTVLVKGTCNTIGILSSIAALTVNEQPEITAQPVSAVICEGSNTSFTVNAGVTTGATYQWQVSTNGGTSYTNVSNGGIYAGATSATLSLTGAPLGNNGYLYRVVVGGTCTPNLISEGALLTVQQAPVITGQPSAQIVCEGSTVTFTVNATGTGLTYQWKKGGVDIGSATGSSLVLSSVSAADAASYTVLVKGTCNTTGILSSVAALTVNEQPEITAQPVSAVICEGSNTSFTVNTGVTTGATYQWQVSSNGGTGYSNISIGGIYSGITSNTLSLNSVPLGNNGYLYRVVVGGACAPNVISEGALLTVQQAPVITGQPSAQIVCEGSTVTFTVNAAGTGLTYQWKKDGVDIGSATSASLVLSSVSATNAADYTVLVKGTCNTTGVLSSVATLTVNEQPEITAQPVSSVICETGNTSFTVNAGVTTGATYQWQISTNGGTGYTNISNGGIYSGATSTTLSLTGAPLTNNGYLYRVVVGGACSPAVTSNGALLTVQQAPVITVQPSSPTVCEGSAVTLSVTAVGTGLTYQWQKNGIDIGGANGSSLVFSSASTADAGNYTVLVKGTCNATGVLSSTGTLTVNRIPNASAADITICSGSTTGIAITNPNGVTGTAFDWTVQSSVNVTGASAGSGNVIAQALTVTDGHTSGLVTYLISPKAAGCTGAAYAVQASVMPVPTVSASPQTICSGESTSVAISNPNAVSGTIFNWTIGSVTNVTGAGAGSGTVISQVLTSTDGVSNGTVSYHITPTAGGCPGTPVDVIVTVSPKPVITNSASTLIAEVCSATTLNFLPTSTLSGTTFTWTSFILGTLSGVSASGNGAITDKPVNATNTSAVIIYTITPSRGGCTGAPIHYVVTVRPVPDAATAGVTTICSGSQTAITISNPNSVSGTTYTWSVFSSTNVTGAGSGSGNVISQVLTSTDGINAGTVIYRITPAANGCAGLPVDVAMTVNPVPVITNTAGSLAVQICSSAPLNFTPSSTIAGTTFTWSSSISGSVSAGSITASGSGPIVDSPVNTGNTAGTVTYRIVPQFNGCSGLPVNYVVTVKPTPTASASNVTICSGQTAIINIQPTPMSVSGTTFTWTAAPSANVLGSANGNGSVISQVLTTTNALIGTVTYSITPTASGCNGSVSTVTATVDPIATVNAGADYSLCEPVTISLSGTLGGSATSGVWSISTGGGTISTSTVSGTTVSAVYTVAAGDIGGSVKFILTTNDPDASGPCSLVTDDLVVNVNRKARVTVDADYVVCEPGSIALSGTLSGSAISGLWSVESGSGSLSATSVTGTKVTANYGVAAADVTQTLRFRLTTNDPDGFGPCVAEFSEVNVHVNESAKVNAGADKAVCEDQQIILNGSFVSPTTSVTWSGGSGAARFSNVADPLATYTLTSGDIANGGITLTLSTNDPDGSGPCDVVADQVFIKINKLPVVGLSNLKPSYAENSPIEYLDGFPAGGVFTGPGIVAGTNQFDPGNAPFGSVIITYTYVDPATGCDNSVSRSTIVNPVTDIDFDIAPVRRDGSGFPIICANSGNLTLVGYPPYNDPSAATAFFRSDDIPSRIGFDGNNYIVKTDGLPAGEYEVQYVYENILGARDTLTKRVTVYSGPKAIISVDRVCQGVELVFTDASYIPGDPSGQITKYYWKYGEFGTGNDPDAQRNPRHTYQTSGLMNVELKVETEHQCVHDTTGVVRVGVKPDLAFDWKKICSGIETTEFQDRSVTTEFSRIKEYQWDFGDGYTLPFGAPDTDVPPGTNDNSTSGTFNNPRHTYSLFKVYNVTLSVNTEENCTTSKTRRVYILDYNIPGPTQGYFTDFEEGAGTWVEISSEASDTSWVFGPLDPGQVINKAASGVNAWWTGSNPNAATDFSTYYKNESSGVIGPCLNLQNLKRPMLSLNYWSDMQAGFDGAVMQYSTDGGLSWETIGNAEGDGISWYNSRDLQSSPGGQDNYAWSGATGGWRNARFNLDQIPAAKRNLVVFRIAFASNSDNPTGAILNGFAFDDVYIGEKHRNVLIEQFTNDLSAPSNAADEYFDNLYAAQFTIKDSSDFITMQYHIASPEADALNKDNPADPNARSLLYGVSQPPTAFMDGIQGEYGPTVFDGGYSKINADEVDRRALTDPLFDIDVELQSGGEAGRLQGRVTYTYIDSTRGLFAPVVLHAALLETGVNGNTNVVRKLLLGQGGRVYSDGWQSGDEVQVPIDYILDVPIVNPNALSVVAFVQDKNTQYIHQAVIVKAPAKEGIGPAVGVEDDPQVALLSDLKIYPNPAAQAFYFGLDQPLDRGYTWKMIDQRGITVLGGNLNRDLKSSAQKVDVSGLANGIYILAIQIGEKALVYRKVAVMNGG